MSDPRNEEIYISVDLETDGPTPIHNSMLSLGAVAYDASGKELGRFYRKLTTLGGHQPDPKTLEWWLKPEQLHAWLEANKNPENAEMVMKDFAGWVKGFTGKPTLVAYPIAFESMWLQSYFALFNVENPLGFNGIDVRSYAMACLNTPYRHSGKDAFLEDWQSNHPMTHIAQDDAINQGESFIKMMQWRKRHNLTLATPQHQR